MFCRLSQCASVLFQMEHPRLFRIQSAAKFGWRDELFSPELVLDAVGYCAHIREIDSDDLIQPPAIICDAGLIQCLLVPASQSLQYILRVERANFEPDRL